MPKVIPTDTRRAQLNCEFLEPRVHLSAALNWQTEAPIPVGHAEGAAFVANGLIYCFGGFEDPQLDISTEMDVYNPAANAWTKAAPCPVKVNDCPAVYDAATQTAWMGGFFLNTGTNASGLVYSYNVANNTWTKEPSLPENLGAGVMAIVGNTLHYFGGRNSQNVGSVLHWTLNLDDISAGWKTDRPMLMTANHAGSAVYDGKIYCIGGIINGEENTGNQSIVQVFDPTTDSWSYAASLPMPLGHIASAVTVANDKIIVAGGEENAATSQLYSQDVLEYDPSTNTWSQLSNPLPAPRASVFLAYINGQLIATAGNMYASPYVANTTWVSKFNPDPSQPTGSVSGTVFNDANGNGTQDSGEIGIGGVTVYIDATNAGVFKTGDLEKTTNSSGVYGFAGLTAGTYIVRQMLPSDDKQISPTKGYGNHVTVTAGQTATNANFGDKSTAVVLASISGTVFNDANGNGVQNSGELGISGVVLYIDLDNAGVFQTGDPQATTNSSGVYSFTGLAGGTYIVRQIPPSGDKQTFPTKGYGEHVTVAAGQVATGANFGDEA